MDTGFFSTGAATGGGAERLLLVLLLLLAAGVRVLIVALVERVELVSRDGVLATGAERLLLLLVLLVLLLAAGVRVLIVALVEREDDALVDAGAAAAALLRELLE
jgi:hypothetical protein